MPQTHKLYPSGMKIPGRAGCNCFSDKKIHNMKTGKFNRDEYNIRESNGTDWIRQRYWV